jgi:hypothetical protein
MLKIQTTFKRGVAAALAPRRDQMNQHRCAETAVIVTKSAEESFGNLLSIQNLNQ